MWDTTLSGGPRSDFVWCQKRIKKSFLGIEYRVVWRQTPYFTNSAICFLMFSYTKQYLYLFFVVSGDPTPLQVDPLLTLTQVAKILESSPVKGYNSSFGADRA